jgi:hypothetical protein
MAKRQSGDPMAEYVRQETILRRLAKNAKCPCGEVRPEALMKTSRAYRCAACDRRKSRRSVFDHHHPAGQSNSTLTVPIRVNAHRARLSVDQYNWPSRTLQNRERSPLLASAACMRGFVDTTDYLADELLARTAVMLEDLDEKLKKRLGRKWWKRIHSKGVAARR